MKKIIFSMLVAGFSCAAFAQVDTVISTNTDATVTNGTITTTTDYNAYSTYIATPPEYMSSYVLRDYPMATDVKWRQENDWWHGYYMNNGVPNHVYYNSAGQTFTVALPVRQSWIPETVISKAVELYGPVIYDINTMKGTNNQEIYTVRLLENGQLSTIWIGEDGTRIMDVYRMETSTENAALSTDVQTTPATPTSTEMNIDKDTKMKIKVENSDGTETKTKIKNGKVKTKTDD